MATRNLTRYFLELREQEGASRYAADIGSGRRDGHQKLLVDLEQESVEMQVPSLKLPPVWVDIVESIKLDMNRIKNELTNLQRLHNSRLKVTFGEDETKQDEHIDRVAAEITTLLHKCENSVKQIALRASQGIESSDLPLEERMVRLNVMRAMGSKIQGLSKQFRGIQKDFLVRLKGLEESGKEFFDEDESSFLGDDLNQQLSQKQLQQLEHAKNSLDHQEREIASIAQSINELATIFRELSVLVVEQGSVLDRIDYNVEQTVGQVIKGRVELDKAEVYSKSKRSLWCILILVIGIAILSLIIAYR